MILLAMVGISPLCSIDHPCLSDSTQPMNRHRDANEPLADRVVIGKQGLQRLLIIP
jgi:hypothetical protein